MNHMKCKLLIAFSLFSCANALANDLVLYDITERDKFTYSTEHKTFVEGEAIEQLFDTSLNSKYISKHSKAWVGLSFEQPKEVLEYSLTSAPDAPARDPKQWVLYGSNDGKNWQELDARNDIIFTKRTETQRFSIKTAESFKHYKLHLAQEGKTSWGDSYLQVSDFSLYASTKLPLSDFHVKNAVTAINQPIDIVSTSANNPTSIVWDIPDAMVFTHGHKAKVYFSKPGTYSVTLNTKNAFGSDSHTQKNVIKVLDKSDPWKGLITPKVNLVIEDDSSEGAKRLLRLFPNIEQTIDRVTRELAPMLYKNFSQLPEFDQVTFTLKWMDTIAYRAGDDTNMQIAFSSKYITERLRGKSDEVVKYELLGVLWHELTHGYQHFPRSVGYDNAEAHAFIEGMADLIRIQAGYHKTRKPTPSENYLGGYTNTGFFLHWLSNNHADFAYRFNKTAIELDKWSFDKAIHKVTGTNVDKLWEDYQSHLNTM